MACTKKCWLQTMIALGSVFVLLQVLFLNNTTIQILPRVFLPDSYTYIDRSSVIYHNDNEIFIIRPKDTDALYRKRSNKTNGSIKGVGKNKGQEKSKGQEKDKKNNTKSEQYVVYKFTKGKIKYSIKESDQKNILFEHTDEKTSFYNGNMSIHNPNPMAYNTVLGVPIYIMSAHARLGYQPENMTFYNGRFKQSRGSMLFTEDLKSGQSAPQAQFISLTAWMHESLIQEELKCCLLLRNQSVVSYTNPRRMVWYQVKKQPLFASKIYCPIPKEFQKEKPIGASLSLPQHDCYLRIFMKVNYPVIRKRGSLAFCTKIAYGSLVAERLIEWMELQKYVGVDRVVIYYYNLNRAAMKVLNRYVKEDFVELQPFDMPQPDDPKREVGDKAAMPFIDEQVAVYDCLERLQRFNYVGIIDLDEIVYTGITPKHNLKPLLRYLTRRYADASGFRFMTELFLTDWLNKKAISPTSNDSTAYLWYSQFVNRTGPMADRVKNILNLERVILDSIWTHNFTSLPGYKRYTISSSLGCLKHFRSCREKWIEDGKCYRLRKYKDYTVVNLMKNVEGTVREKKTHLLKPSHDRE